LNDYSFTSAPQLKRDPLGSLHEPKARSLFRSQRSFSVLFLATLIIAEGCNRQRANNTVTLQVPDSTLCHQAPLLIHVRGGGGYALNSAPLDSAALAAWLRGVLPQRKEGERAVFVQLDSGQSTAELRWIVAGIERAGGRAYKVVPTCEYLIS
jgi:hypothetical protein